MVRCSQAAIQHLEVMGKHGFVAIIAWIAITTFMSYNCENVEITVS